MLQNEYGDSVTHFLLKTNRREAYQKHTSLVVCCCCLSLQLSTITTTKFFYQSTFPDISILANDKWLFGLLILHLKITTIRKAVVFMLSGGKLRDIFVYRTASVCFHKHINLSTSYTRACAVSLHRKQIRCQGYVEILMGRVGLIVWIDRKQWINWGMLVFRLRRDEINTDVFMVFALNAILASDDEQLYLLLYLVDSGLGAKSIRQSKCSFSSFLSIRSYWICRTQLFYLNYSYIVISECQLDEHSKEEP